MSSSSEGKPLRWKRLLDEKSDRAPEFRGIAETIESIRHDHENQGAWTAFYTYCRRQIAGMYFVLGIRNNDELEELCQEVFYRFLNYSPWRRSWETLPAAPKILAYLRVVARNVLYTHFEKRRFPGVSLQELEMDQAHILAARVAEAALGDLMRDLQVLKRDLTEEEQKLLGQLIQGLSLSEIADKLGISYTSAGVRLHRLRKKLRRSAGVF